MEENFEMNKDTNKDKITWKELHFTRKEGIACSQQTP